MIADQLEREQLRAATPGARFLVCDLTAPEYVLKDRVAAREPNEFWRTKLREFVDLDHQRTDLPGIRNFQVNTHGCNVDEAAWQVVEKAGWAPPLGRTSSWRHLSRSTVVVLSRA